MFTRRQFLEDSILAATAALAGPVLAAPGTAQAAKDAGANERLAVAVIGAGIRGPVHARSFAGRGDCDVVAVCDADLGRARRLAGAMAKQQGHEVPAYQEGVTAIPPSGGGVVERRLFSLDAVFDEVVPFAV
jgi:ornithine cyclodeaminase/alanine dehydrogenase-like protein (mu-crystallin family)